MPVPSQACDCDTRCPDFATCGCIGVIGPPESCSCTCDDTPITLPFTFLKAADLVNVSVKGLELGALAEFLQKHADGDVLVPAARMRSNVTMSLEGVTFASALEELGLGLKPHENSAD